MCSWMLLRIGFVKNRNGMELLCRVVSDIEERERLPFLSFPFLSFPFLSWCLVSRVSR